MRIPNRLMPHGGLVTYRPLSGIGPRGDVFGSEQAPRRAKIAESNRLVRTVAGEQTVSSAQVWLDPEHVVPVGSRVVIWAGTPRARETTVIMASYLDHPPLPSHVFLALE